MSTIPRRVRNTIRNVGKSIKKKLSSEAVSGHIECDVRELKKDEGYAYDLKIIAIPSVDEDASHRDASASADDILNGQIPPSMAYGIIQVNKKPLANAAEKTVAQNLEKAFENTGVQKGLVNFLKKAFRPGALYDFASLFVMQALLPNYIIKGKASIQVKFEVQKDGSILLINTYSAPYMKKTDQYNAKPEVTQVNVRIAHKIEMQNGVPKVSLIDKAFNVEGTNEEDLNTIGVLLAAKLDVKFKADAKKMHGSALFDAAASEDLATVKVLLQAGIQQSIKDDEVGMVFRNAANRGDTQFIKATLYIFWNFPKVFNTNIYAADAQGRTAFHYAADAGQIKVLRLLIPHMDVNVTDDAGMTPLHYAIKSGFVDAVRFLRENGADVDLKDNSGKSAADYVLESQGSDSEKQELIDLLTKPIVVSMTLENIRCRQIDGVSKIGDIAEFSTPADFETQSYKDLRRDAHDITVSKDSVLTKSLRELALSLPPDNKDITPQEQEEKLKEIRQVFRDMGFDESVIAAIIKTFNQGNLFARLETNICSSLNSYREGYPAYVPMNKTTHHDIQWIEGGGARITETLDVSVMNADAPDGVLATIRGKSSITIKIIDGQIELDIENIKVDVIENKEAKGSTLHVKQLADRVVDGLYSGSTLSMYARTGNFKLIEKAIIDRELTAKNIDIPDRAKKTLLHHAAKRGHLDIVAVLMAMGAQNDIEDASEKTAEMYLKELTDADPVMLEIIEILQNPAEAKNVNVQDYESKTALYFAVLAGNLELVEKILAARANLEFTYNFTRDPRKSERGTILHYAVMVGNVGVVDALIDAGANTTAKDRFGKTPLHYAVGRGNADMVKALLRKNRDSINEADSAGKTALQYAVEKGDTAIIRILLDAQASLPLTHSDKHSVSQSNTNIPNAILLLLEQKGVDVQDEAKRTALQYAVRENSDEVVEMVLAFGPSLDLANSEGKTAAHYAATRKNAKVLQMLVAKGADLTCRDKKGMGVLHYAAEVGNVDAITFLLALNKPEIHFPDFSGQTALHYAVKSGNAAVVEALIEAGVDVNATNFSFETPLHYAAEQGNFEIVNLLLENGAKVNLQAAQGKTALHCAAVKGNADSVKSLIAAGANMEARNFENKTPLQSALQHGCIRQAAILIDRGADVSNLREELLSKKGKEGKTVLSYLSQTKSLLSIIGKDKSKMSLFYAISARNLDLVKQLLAESSADLTARDSSGHSAVHYAAKIYANAVKAKNQDAIANAEAIFFALIDAGADIMAKDRKGKRALDYIPEGTAVKTYLHVLVGVEGYIQHLAQSKGSPAKRKAAQSLRTVLMMRGDTLANRLADFKGVYETQLNVITLDSTDFGSGLSSLFKRMFSQTQDILNPTGIQTHAQAFTDYIGKELGAIDKILEEDLKQKTEKAEAVIADEEENIQIIPLNLPADYLQILSTNSQEPQATDPIAVRSEKLDADDEDMEIDTETEDVVAIPVAETNPEDEKRRLAEEASKKSQETIEKSKQSRKQPYLGAKPRPAATRSSFWGFPVVQTTPPSSQKELVDGGPTP